MDDSAGRGAEGLLGVNSRKARDWSLALWFVTVALLVIMAVPALTAIIQPLDDRVWELAVSMEGPVLVALAEMLDVVGGLLVMAPVMVGIAIFLAWRRRWAAFAAWLMAMVASQVLSVLIKENYDRPRPPAPLVDVTDTGSFPSGQAVTAAAVVLMVIVLSRLRGTRLLALVVVGTAYALLIAASRVYLRVHWLSDVVAGLVIGAACAISAALVVDAWRKRRAQPGIERPGRD